MIRALKDKFSFLHSISLPLLAVGVAFSALCFSILLAIGREFHWALLLTIGYVLFSLGFFWLLSNVLTGYVVRKANKDQPSQSDQPELRRRKRIVSLRKEAAKMRRRIVSVGLITTITMIAFALYMYYTSGLYPEDVFLLPWWLLVVSWFLIIALFPVWITYSILVGCILLRMAFEIWGPEILILLPNFLMLPFFYFFMMIFMFGSIMIPNLMQLKFFKPGDATWEVPKGTMRGQPEARAIIELEMTKFDNYAKGLSDRPATRGMIMAGPPGTGKTLMAKEIGTEYDLPLAFADSQAFNAPFMGFGPLIVYYFKWRAESLAKEYGGAIVFLDECETVFQQRYGMGGSGGQQPPRKEQIWDLFPRDEKGRVWFGSLLIDSPSLRCEARKPISHPIFFGGGGIGMGANVAIFPFLTWMDGADAPSWKTRLVRRKINDLMNALFLPVTVGNRILRLPPGKPVKRNIMFMGATNRLNMLDDAIRRPGRFGITVHFRSPDYKSRIEIAELYFNQCAEKGWIHPDLNTQEKYEEFARATQGLSPAEIEAVIKHAPDVRVHFVEQLRRIGKMLDQGVPFDELLDDDKKFWRRNGHLYGKENWDDPRADWWSVMEARSQIIWGRANPGVTSESSRASTAVHEFVGHFMPLKAFVGDSMRPQVLTIMPRGNALGLVAYVPIEERDPMPQRHYEALLRISIGSVLAERYFFGENEPGVVLDLEHATNIVCFMLGKCAMLPYNWLNLSDEQKDYYARIGESFISVQPNSLAEKLLSNESNRNKAAVFLGMAAVDVYRLIQANAHLAQPVVSELLDLDEFSGAKLEELWNWLDDNMHKNELGKYISDDMPKPDVHFAIPNPFYVDFKPKGVLENDS